jgi:uncharacterized protein (TIGR00369 family)
VEITLEQARALLAAQPFSRLLGTRLVHAAPGEGTLEIPVDERLLQQDGYVHGGVLAYAADNAITFAGGLVLGPRVLTGGMSIDYLAPARGDLLRAHAVVLHHSARRATARCDVTVVGPGAAVTLCAAAQGTVVAVGARG